MSAILLLLVQSVAAPQPRAPYASAVDFTCHLHTENGSKKIVAGHIDPIMDATGYGSAAFQLRKDDTGLMRGAKVATMTGSPKPPRWFQIEAQASAGQVHMLQLYLYEKGVTGNGFITRQDGGLSTAASGARAAGLCYSDFGTAQ